MSQAIFRRCFEVALFLGAFVVAARSVSAVEPKEGAKFFEAKVAPLLKEHCYSCHSHATGKMRGGLSLDSRSGWEKGGDSGPALIPGEPDKSLLIQAIRYIHADTKMPPKGKLDDAAIGVLVEWVRLGAADPRVLVKSNDLADWWSLKPLKRPAPPGTGHPVDAFVQAKLREKNLSPAPEADRRALIRRLTFDLHGLPPTLDEVEDFAASRDPQAYEKLVDRLLASPRYGERWARHWLDIIRYGDSNGNEHDGFRPHAWRYRDYVIDAFNSDKPYDRFVQEQLAADALFPDEPALTAALGFLAAGPVVLGGTEYLIRDEYVTQVMSAISSATAHCARCHNHKFDAISQDDYYALQAVFAGVQRREAEVDLDPEIRKQRSRWQALKAAAASKDANLLSTPQTKTIVSAWEKDLREKGPRWTTLRPQTATAHSKAEIQRRDDGSLFIASAVAENDVYTLDIAGPLENVRLLRLEMLLDAKLPGGGPGLASDGGFSLSEIEIHLHSAASDKPKKLSIKSAQAEGNSKENPIASAFDGKAETSWHGKAGQAGVATFDLGTGHNLAAEERLSIVLRRHQTKKQNLGRFRLSTTDQAPSVYSLIPVVVSESLAVPEAKRSDAEWLAAAAYVLPMVSDAETKRLPAGTTFYVIAGKLPHEGKSSSPERVHVLKRGEMGKPMNVAGPGALSCIPDLTARLDAEATKDESKRRAYLAIWLSDAKNPLTWRSIVNRVWQHHFGCGIVDTPSDFGHMGSLPSHPELLDWLACEFRDGGMSFKKLHKTIVMSATYRQSTAPNAKAQAIDAENRLLWRMNRNRLDAESFRDAVLAVSGRLDLSMGGPGVMQFEVKQGFNTTKLANYDAVDWNAPGVNRRSVYRFIFRTRPDPFMSALDFPDASQFVPTRVLSITPLQALALFNSNFMLQHSALLAKRVAEKDADTIAQVKQAFRLVLQREPTAPENAAFIEYAQRHGMPALCRVLLNSNEFLFVE